MFVSQKVWGEKGNITDARISAIDIGSPYTGSHCAVAWDKFMLVSRVLILVSVDFDCKFS